MSNCPYEIGDKVKNHGLCGTVTAKEMLGGSWILTVELDNGGQVSWDCSDVTGC